MAGKTVLERKIDWWFRNIDKELSTSDFELIKLSEFDENHSLVFKEKIRFYDIIKLVKRVTDIGEIPNSKS
ncbi:hypothetical protein ES703_110595 [subsurface metagenome]